ncbi:MAG: hypothetical protein CM1200mP29_02410 [Verrucomicrobiota bacterium]|nr:MAG: hypothetical protein CM1200mP29_02410 [Verrucomicrobiota bacterium]
MDQTFSVVNRGFLEKVNGVYPGAAFSFLKGFGSGNISAYMHPNGTLFVGGTDRGWGARGGKRFALDRVTWKGGVPFEIHEMRAKPDGFELTFTHEVEAVSAANLGSYSMSAYTYIYRSDYGSPVVDKMAPKDHRRRGHQPENRAPHRGQSHSRARPRVACQGSALRQGSTDLAPGRLLHIERNPTW